ncbi:hypothetical protein PAE9249_00631 [Paenibacillus sp. CECT 9249]|uniref:cache domain-containing sensor histidine kinase n=1 Tax=Paenibacillus sp. CECT 9249 TaxID=2845385 RepID=UPI001E4CA433|nr:histidine kinase [Paenibacillus sp. CECT 9249]CAH0118165.1 hypothetical protein PAE9249_00631 [Paenibacillus sp. CECT 9249]
MRGSISRKLYVYFLIVILLSLSIIGAVTFTQSTAQLERQSERYMSQMINSAVYHTDLYLQTYEKASKSILSDSDVMKFVDMEPDNSYDYYFFKNQIEKRVFDRTFTLYPQVNLIALIGDKGRALITHHVRQIDANEYDPMEWYALLDEKLPASGGYEIMNTKLSHEEGDHWITLARRVRGLLSHDPHGILALELNTDEISKLWGNMDLGSGGYSFIIDDSGAFIDKPKEVPEADLLDERLKQKLLGGNKLSFMSSVGDGEKRMYVAQKLESANWRLVISVPVRELREPIHHIQRTIVIVAALTFLLALWISIRFGRSIVRPIQLLTKAMRETEKGNWMQIQEIRNQDETGYMIRSYNLMVTRLSEMIERVYEAELDSKRSQLEVQRIELERHKAEFQALQLQINPHFLYNTLEAIKCYAVVQDSEEIMEMVEAMAFMLRYAIQTNLQDISVVNELKHVLNYMTILQYRSQKPFELDVRVPSELLLYRMVRLTLQPLVENAFLHAFPQGLQEHHYIRIQAEIAGDRFQVIVEDNGEGMPEEKLKQIRRKLELNQLAETDSHSIYHQGGIGLMNVHRRIQMVYGEQYGLTVESALSQGTRMIMSMPFEQSMICTYGGEEHDEH